MNDEVKLKVAREALQWAVEFFTHRDHMNAKVHCAPARLSPITERVLEAIALLDKKEEQETEK